jgi:hypothetical protein
VTFAYVTRHHIVGTPNRLRLRLELRFLPGFGKVVAIEHREPLRLLQVRHQRGFRLAAEPIDTIAEHAAHEARSVVELAHRYRHAHTLVRDGRRVHLFHGQLARGFRGAAGQHQRSERRVHNASNTFDHRQPQRGEQESVSARHPRMRDGHPQSR